MKRILSAILLLGLMLLPVCSFAQEGDSEPPNDYKSDYSMTTQWGVGIKAGIGGIGIEAIKGLGDRLNVRLGYSTLSIPYSIEQTFEGFDLLAEAEVKLGGASLLVDYYLVKNFVHLTAGIMQNRTAFGVTVTPLSGMPYGDLTIPPEDIGMISGQLSSGNLISPYLALGFGNTLSRKHMVSFNFEIGTLYHGNPSLDLNGEGIIGPLASEENETVIMEAIAQYKWMPMLTLQLSFKIL
ncbi:MAG: hypothetical protein KAH17_05720 [Bacteroidales bacterium]|nr:hypothetical protein [Bacteroidales bacterium]